MAVIKTFVVKMFRTCITWHKMFVVTVGVVFHLLAVTEPLLLESIGIFKILVSSFSYFPFVI